MKVLVTGSNGFIGKNLCAQLRNLEEYEVLEYDVDTSEALLFEYAASADFVFHLAGVNRPQREEEFMEGNCGFTAQLIHLLKQAGNRAPVLATSSIQAELDNPYGNSKRAGEELLLQYEEETGASVFIYRLPNVFGKWCRPNYNSVIATFCHKIARGEEITVNDPSTQLSLVYIDDVVTEFLSALIGKAYHKGAYCAIPVVHKATLGDIANWLCSFRDSRSSLSVPDMSNILAKKLYSTYLSYLPEDQFAYELKKNEDERGSFTEFVRTVDRGQFSVNVARPGVTKGNHWHHTKNEKFLVVSGEGMIQFRKIGGDEIIEYRVNGAEMKVVDIPTGYTHNITNVGQTDLVTLMWANEAYDPNHPDTYFLKV